MTSEEIERRFAALDERIAQVDAALARMRDLTAAMNARLLAHEEYTAAPEIRHAMSEFAALTADENGEYPGDVETAAASLPWVLSEDQTRWTADRPDGRTAVVERLDDGVSFLPCVGDANGVRPVGATGPVCSGWIPAAAWAARFASR